MNILNIKKKSALKFIHKQLKNAGNSKKNIPGKIRTVGLISEAAIEETEDISQKILKTFRKVSPGVTLSKLLYSEVQDPEKTMVDVFSEADFNLFGKVKSNTLKQFTDREFDLLINLIPGENVFATMLVLQSKAGFKAGFHSDEFPVYDLSVKVPSDRKEAFVNELLRYLQIMNLL